MLMELKLEGWQHPHSFLRVWGWGWGGRGGASVHLWVLLMMTSSLSDTFVLYLCLGQSVAWRQSLPLGDVGHLCSDPSSGIFIISLE